MKKQAAALVLGTMIIGSGVAEAGKREAVFGAVAAIMTTAIIAGQSKHRSSSKRHYKKSSRKKASYRKSSRRKAVVVMTDEKRIQKSLTSLGFYKGAIDGSINSYETRDAIKRMNEAYGISRTSHLKPEVRDQLIYLANLYDMDKKLNALGNTKNRKGARLQAALKVHGVYSGKIDGVVGKGTRKAIREYQSNKGYVPTGKLAPDETYDLISSAIAKNDRNIHSVIDTLKVEKVDVPVQRVAESKKSKAAETAVVTDTPKPAQTVASSEGDRAETQVEKVNTIMQGGQVEAEDDDFALPDA